MKFSQVPHDRQDEVTVFKAVQGYIGVPNVLGSYDADCIHLSQPPSSSNISQPDSQPYLPCYHRHLIIGSIGRRLEFATGPRELAEGLLHAMIGHYALFTEGRQLHRDVSIGNIMLLDVIKEIKIPPGLNDLVNDNLKRTRGTLIDGDAAQEWGTTNTPSYQAGTKPFISLRVTGIWANKQEYMHTPIDDLESFLWVLIDNLFIQEEELVDKLDAAEWTQLNSNELGLLNTVKKSLLADCNLSVKDTMKTFVLFAPLLQAWSTIAYKYQDSLSALLKTDASLPEIEGLSLQAYADYIEAAQEHIPTLPVHWS
ncbi:hypothetical protein HGRIS_000144 [Hohenbuehelia grisea]|uniref:Fungal-type protein kinase domain-containing protein n=1 Tax=Hohenbuehelia grisea TaxID=104357 RepID=A0ABR3JR49_9AGAR